jgi:hypothetical protein
MPSAISCDTQCPGTYPPRSQSSRRVQLRSPASVITQSHLLGGLPHVARAARGGTHCILRAVPTAFDNGPGGLTLLPGLALPAAVRSHAR